MKPINGAFQPLRILVESELGSRAVVIVASATDDDSSTFVAGELARAYLEVGKSPALISAASSEFTQKLRADGLQVFTYAKASEVIDAFRDDESFRFNMIIIDAPCFLSDGFALAIAGRADGILCAVREGRSICPEDREIALHAERSALKRLGVVMTPEFKRRRDAKSPEINLSSVRTADVPFSRARI